ncbi:MAG TPA: N-acetylmuramoyl-L-alanine amidase [Usitatibacter sp.]|nr:N-acetylmuramoyl-L-alanine amidase [Usitatibacter sp.]
MKRWLSAAAALLLAACAGAPPVDTTYSAASQDSRIQFIVLHFTSTDFPESLRTLTQGEVSAHYLVRDDPVLVYRLVDDSQRAWHAGESAWEGNTQLNSASIGIEIVNRGDRDGAWQDYPPRQADAVVDLVGELVRKYHVRPDHVVGHSDIAPLRKLDPGPRFPWKRLADAGLAEWPAADLVAAKRPAYEAAKPDAEWFQQRLACVGYPIERTGRFDEQTRRVLAAFQMHFRPADFSGAPDGESAAILDALVSMRPGDASWCAG